LPAADPVSPSVISVFLGGHIACSFPVFFHMLTDGIEGSNQFHRLM